MSDAPQTVSPLVRLTGGRTGLFARNRWAFLPGQQWAMTGADGAAKAALCAWIGAGVPPSAGVQLEMDATLVDRVRFVSFSQQSAVAQKTGFLQARYHSIEDEAGPGEEVAEFLSFNRVFDVNPFEVGRPLRDERRVYRASYRKIVRLLNLTALLDRPVLALSNGENRRVLLARAILANPRLLVLDDPCAGLDPERREQMKAVCTALAARGVSLLINVRHADEIPSCVTDVMVVAQGRIRKTCPPNAVSSAAPVRVPSPVVSRTTGSACSSRTRTDAPPVVVFRDVCISFGRRKLFDHFSWTVRRGERWVLRGANGSGKTTLMALIVGDSPLAYANDVTVFGHRRGTPGVALAEIRARIGMVSPEQQACTGRSPFKLLEDALAQKPDLLILDEPCLNLDEPSACALKRRVSAWLGVHRTCAAICVAHRSEDVPSGFTQTLDLT